MKSVFLFIAMAITAALSAQSIKGVIASAKDKAPIEFAPVALLQLPDSTLVTGNTSQTGGLFAFTNIKPGNYYLRATYVGFSPIGRTITMQAADNNLLVDTLFMSETSKNIDEVVVKGERIKGTEMVDRTVYAIPAEVSKASPNAYDLLKKVPSISVDYNDDISLNGSRNFIIQVDGKQRDKEYLARLQPSDIETVEVVTNPSGKYEGNIDGVLNIKLKREARFGLSGNTNIAGRPSKQTSANLSGGLDYAMGNATVYFSGFGFYNNLNSNIYNNNLMRLKDSASYSNGGGTYQFLVGAVNTGVDYFIDKNQSFSFNANYKPVYNQSDMEQNSDIKMAGISNYTQDFSTMARTVSHEINTSAFYKRQFANPLQEFNIEVSHYRFISTDKNNLFRNTIQLHIDTITVLRTENIDNNRNATNIKADYVQPLGMDAKIETGVQLYNQNMDYQSIYNYDTRRNDFNYSELREAAYLGGSYNVGKFGFQATLRVEHSNIFANKDSDYFCFLPSANVMFKFNSKNNIKFTYNRRINRPGLGQLNPFRKIGFNDEISSGNPLLTPEYRDKLQLTYTLNIDKSYISQYISHEMFRYKIDNLMQTGTFPFLGKETFITSTGNFTSGSEQAVGINAMILFININFRYYKGHFNEYKSIKAKNYESFSLGGWAFAPLPWKMNWFAFANYGGYNPTLQGSSMSPFFYGTGIRKEMGNHTLGMFYLLPFTPIMTVMKNTTNTPQIYSQSKATFDSRYFIQIQYSYKFNKGKAVKKVARQTEAESDSKKGGLGGGN